MKVFKFGGASVNSIERVRNMAGIMKRYNGERILVVVSAMGKTTNALEKVAEAFFAGKKEEALALFTQVKTYHLDMAKFLLVRNALPAGQQLSNTFTEVEWLLHDKPVRDYDYYYDQIVCAGELLSTQLISACLDEAGIRNTWIDVRDLFRTDNNFREANIDWDHTLEQVRATVVPELVRTGMVVTQGFIGSTPENESTTLGREGSDYSAAVFANMLDARDQTIWKDVEGVMNADPKLIPDAEIIRELNYDEVIEMAYYGAQVIHPKTIKPLQNKNIPLLVKCFLEPDLPGTVIHNRPVHDLPPIIVWKQQQVMIALHSRDFSFVGEKPVARLYEIMAGLKMRPNLIQTGAVSLQFCTDDRPERIERFAHEASELFDVEMEKGLSLLTVRHYREGVVEKLISGRMPILRQQTPDTIQLVLR
jgi:aspartate kinase